MLSPMMNIPLPLRNIKKSISPKERLRKNNIPTMKQIPPAVIHSSFIDVLLSKSGFLSLNVSVYVRFSYKLHKKENMPIGNPLVLIMK